jgi:hypothetical protein
MMVLMYMTVKKMRLSQKGIKMSAFDEWWETYIPVWDIEGRDTREAWNAALDAAAKEIETLRQSCELSDNRLLLGVASAAIERLKEVE